MTLLIIMLSAAGHCASASALERVSNLDSALHCSAARCERAGQPFTGIVEQIDADGRRIAEVAYDKGRRSGLQRRWSAEGTLLELRRYKQGVPIGQHQTWWPNGRLRMQAEFVDGLPDGERSEWHSNGQLAALLNYSKGHENGRQRGWDAEGNSLFNYVYRDGRRYGVLGSHPCYSVADGTQSEP